MLLLVLTQKEINHLTRHHFASCLSSPNARLQRYFLNVFDVHSCINQYKSIWLFTASLFCCTHGLTLQSVCSHCSIRIHALLLSYSLPHIPYFMHSSNANHGESEEINLLRKFYVVTLQESNKVKWHHTTELSKWVDSEEQLEFITIKASTGFTSGSSVTVLLKQAKVEGTNKVTTVPQPINKSSSPPFGESSTCLNCESLQPSSLSTRALVERSTENIF